MNVDQTADNLSKWDLLIHFTNGKISSLRESKLLFIIPFQSDVHRRYIINIALLYQDMPW